jgi:hypothetical protein
MAALDGGRQIEAMPIEFYDGEGALRQFLADAFYKTCG